MKTPEDEAFDELARKQGAWGGGFKAKQAMAADKLQEPERAALELCDYLECNDASMEAQCEAAAFIRKALAQPAQEPVAHSVISGALFDFMGWLTSRKKRIVLSSADEASPAVDAIRDFAKMRGLSLDDAQVREWIDALAQPAQERKWVGLTEEDFSAINQSCLTKLQAATSAESILKEKNS